MLVAADGGGSRVRRQYLPHAERIDTGIVGIAGKVFLDDDSRERIAPELRKGMTLAPGRGRLRLFVALQEIDGVAMKGFGGNDESAAAGAHFDNARSYLMWAFGARREKLGFDGRDIGADVGRGASQRSCWTRWRCGPGTSAFAISCAWPTPRRSTPSRSARLCRSHRGPRRASRCSATPFIR